MTTAIVAALTAALALGLVEGLGRFYPARATWWRLRRRHGRRAVWAMRWRFEAAAEHRSPRVLAWTLCALVVAWIAASSLLDKRWYEVVGDVLPYWLVSIALLRAPSSLRKSAARMQRYEDEAGDDPLKEIEGPGDGGPTAIAL